LAALVEVERVVLVGGVADKREGVTGAAGRTQGGTLGVVGILGSWCSTENAFRAVER